MIELRGYVNAESMVARQKQTSKRTGDRDACRRMIQTKHTKRKESAVASGSVTASD